jgi:hypothetical protein
MVGVALLPVIGVAASASAADGAETTGWKKVRVSFTAVVPESNLLATECQESDPELCLYISSSPNMTLSGGMVGIVDAGTTVGTSPSGILALATVGTFVGTIEGCGAGTFLYIGTSIIQSDPTGPLTDEVVPGTGTGDLEGITGTITINPDDSLTAVFRCQRR